MPWFSLRSLRVKLQLFALLLVLVPGALFALIALARARTALEHAVGRQLAEVAHDVLAELTDALATEQSNVRTWARQDVMRDVLVGDLDKRIARFLRSLTDGGAPYVDLLCVDRDGRLVGTSDPARLGGTLPDRSRVRAALSGEESLTGPVEAADGGPAVVEIAAPIRDPERPTVVIGALLGRYDWRRVMALAGRIRTTLAPHGLLIDVVLLDRGGAVLGAVFREGLDPAAVDDLRAAGARAARSLRADQQRGYLTEREAAMLVGYEREGATNWLALVMQPLSEAFAPIRDMEGRLALAFGGVLLGALGVATFLGVRMSRPLQELTRATQEIAHAGKPRRPVAVRSRDERSAPGRSVPGRDRR